MTRQEFLDRLKSGLSGFPPGDIEERLAFYSEMIDDRMEEGCTEQQAVDLAGSVEDIVAQALADTPLVRLAKERVRPHRRLSAGVIVLLIVGSPLWLSLGVAALSVLLSLYAVLWPLVVSLWAVFVSLAATAPASLAAGVLFTVLGKHPSGGVLIGAGIALAGVSILFFFAVKAATKGAARLTRGIAMGVKKCFVKKEDAK